MTHIDFWRQLDIVSPTELTELRVTLIGAGGIGSPTALALAKMGLSQIVIYDDDQVENHNFPNQLYRIADLGKPKVEALREIVSDFAGVEVEAKTERFEDQPLSGVVISGVDTMAARSQIWQRIRYHPAVQLYCEARMGGEVARIQTVRPCDPQDVRWYETTLHSDADAQELPCTAQAIIYNVFCIAGLIASQVKKFAKEQDFPKEIIFDLVTLTLLTQ